MTLVMKASAAAISAALIALLLKRSNPELALLLSVMTLIVVSAASLRFLDDIRELQDLAQERQDIEEPAVLPLEIDRYYIPFIFAGALDEVLLPFQIPDLPFAVDALETAASTGREGEHIGLALPHPLLLHRLLFAEHACFADGRP